jgi:predicted dehydrogenase
MNIDPVKIGVVGVGRFGRLHALTLAGLAEARLVALVDPNDGELLPGIPRWKSLDRALAESGAEAWVVATNTATHVEIARTILQAGKFVLLEKPLARSLAEAETLRPLVKPDSSNLMLGHVMLFNSEFVALRDQAARRGPIHYINSVRHRPAAARKMFPDDPPVRLLMVHDLYMAQALLNRAEPTEFSCRSRSRDGAVDVSVAQIAWRGNTLGTFTASFLTPDGMAPDGFDRLEVFGDGWAARITPNPRPIELWDKRRAHFPASLEIRADGASPAGMLAEQLRCFCRVARDVEKVPVGATYDDALQVMCWIEQLEASERC